VRSATKTFVGLAGIGVMIAAARAGLPVATAAATPTDSATSTATPTPTDSPTPTPTATSTAKATTTPKPKSTKSSSSSSSGSTAGASGSKTGGTISYKFGVVQVSVTKSGGKITDVNLIQGTATKGRDAAFPSLIKATISNNGTSFGNLSGATYTTNAFKKAVNSALAKF
jgi:uncharacterized protein with FMN-binding domain